MANTLPGLDNQQVDSPLAISHEKAENSSNQDALIKYVLEKVDRDRQALRPRKEFLEKCNSQYKGIVDNRNYDGLANLHIPETLKAVETINSILQGGIFGAPNFVRFAEREKSDKVSADNMTDLNKYQMDENGFELTMESLGRQLLIYGTCVGKVMWDFKQKESKKRLRGEEKPSKQLETTKDTWILEEVDIADLILPPNTPWKSIDSADYVAEIKSKPKSFIKDKIKKNWISKSQALKVIEANPTNLEDESLQKNRDRLSESGIQIQKDTEDAYSWIEYWGLLPAKYVADKDDLYEEDDLVLSVCIILNRDTVVKLDKIINIFWHNELPYVSCPFIPLQGEFFAIGVPQVLYSLQRELDDTRNQVMDNKTFGLSNMWIADALAGLNVDHIQVEPMKVIRVKDKSGLVPVQPPMFFQAGINVDGIIKEDMRQAVNAISGLQGVPQAGVGSATEFQGLMSAAMSRNKMVIKRIGLCLLTPLFRKVIALVNQFYDHKRLIRIIGEEGIRHRFLTPDEIIGNMDVVLELSTDFEKNPNVLNQQLQQFAMMMIKMSPEQIQFHWNLLNRLAEALGQKGFEQDYPAPISADTSILLEPKEELELIMQNQPVSVKPGDNHVGHLQEHQRQHKELALALPPIQADLLAAHVRDHMQYIQQMMKQAQQQQQMQMMQMQQIQSSNGKVRNSSAETMTQPLTDNALRREVEG